MQALQRASCRVPPVFRRSPARSAVQRPSKQPRQLPQRTDSTAAEDRLNPALLFRREMNRHGLLLPRFVIVRLGEKLPSGKSNAAPDRAESALRPGNI